MQTKKRVQTGIGKLLFHRMGVVAVLIIAQLARYFVLLMY